jgi:hypothetical protein
MVSSDVAAFFAVSGEDFALLGGIESERFEDGVRCARRSRGGGRVDVRRILAELESGVDDADVALVRKAGLRAAGS